MCGGSPLSILVEVNSGKSVFSSRGDSQERRINYLTLVLPSLNRFCYCVAFVLFALFMSGRLHRVEL